MNPIRPSISPPVPGQAAQRPDAARLDAQRAFFEMAMGRATAPVAAVATAPTAVAAPVQRLAQPSAEAPAKILRPGSLLDIRV